MAKPVAGAGPVLVGTASGAAAGALSLRPQKVALGRPKEPRDPSGWTAAPPP